MPAPGWGSAKMGPLLRASISSYSFVFILAFVVFVVHMYPPPLLFLSILNTGCGTETPTQGMLGGEL
eukprot:scaffold6454_cov113-Isochrysis_galbana.AAC.7